MSTQPIQSAQSAGPESRQAQAIAGAISTDLTVIREAEAGMRRALDCLRAGLDDRFLDELQDIAKAYLDSERGRLFAIRNNALVPDYVERRRI
jgi:hypothetical protein